MVRLRAALVAQLLVLFSSGCASHFKSVAATGLLGEKLATHDRALAAFDESCQINAALLDTDRSQCDAVKADAQVLQKVAGLLAAYGHALSQLADKKHGLDIEREVNAVIPATNSLGWGALEKSQGGAVANLARVVADVLSDRYKKRTLDTVIHEVNGSLQTVVSDLTQAIDTRIRELDELDLAVVDANAMMFSAQLRRLMDEGKSGPVSAATPAAVAQAPQTSSPRASRRDPGLVALEASLEALTVATSANTSMSRDAVQALRPLALPLRLQAALLRYDWVPRKRQAFVELKAAASAFAKAHDALDKNRKKLDEKELFAAVLEIAKSVYGDVAKLATPAK